MKGHNSGATASAIAEVFQTLNPKSCKMIYRKKEKNKNQKMGKHLTCHFSSFGFRLLISFVPSAALYLGC